MRPFSFLIRRRDWEIVMEFAMGHTPLCWAPDRSAAHATRPSKSYSLVPFDDLAGILSSYSNQEHGNFAEGNARSVPMFHIFEIFSICWSDNVSGQLDKIAQVKKYVKRVQD